MIPHDCLEDLAEELYTTSPNPKDSSSENEHCNPETEDSVSETKDSVPESQKSDWIESVASLSCISSLMYDCQALVNDARKSDIPNTEQWIVEARDTIKQVQESCSRFLENTDSLLQEIQTKKPKVNDTSSSQDSRARSRLTRRGLRRQPKGVSD